MQRSLVILAAAACGPRSPTVTVPAPPPNTTEVPVAGPPAPAAPAKDYPATRKDANVDKLHGVDVADPYRWLEDATKPDVAEWMKAQDSYARQRIAKLPRRDALASRLREVFYFDAISAPIHRKDRFFYSRKHKDKEKRVAYWKTGENGKENVLLDPNTWSTDGSTGLHGYSVSWDGRYVAYNVSEHNADETTTKVLEVTNGKLLPDTITGTKFGGASWTPDSRAFYYTYTPPASDAVPESERNAHSEVRFHKLGTDPKNDAVVHAATGNAENFLNGAISEDGHWLFTTIAHGSSGATSWFFKDARKPSTEWTTLIDGIDATTDVVDYKDKFYVRTNDGAPRYRVFVVDPKKPARAEWKEIVPQQEATLDGADVVGGYLVLNYLRSAASELEIHALDGKLVRKVDLPPLGSASGMLGRADEDTAYFHYTSYTEPGTIFKTSIKTGKVETWTKVELPVDTKSMMTEQVRYKSKDGTEVTMFLVHKKDVAKNGKVPTLLTGYGGFQISETPGFSPTYAVWVENGGLLAIPNLRGGGEYGEDWHKAGMMGNKQNVFDDFIGAGHYLVDTGWTSRDHLAIFGGSNGGLLMGAATVQAPEMWKAVVCAVPLLDMVRYHKFGLGKAWVSEYGSAEDATQFKALHAYSPYHHVKDGTHYPALLMLSSDHDDRVDPMHARKMVGALQAATGGDAPIWLRIEQNAGHGGADVVRQQVEQWADTFAFVMWQLGMSPG
jgi:prolyl oligopeptidase